MNELKVFENPAFGQMRTVEIDNEPWFVGKDVAVALGYSDTKSAISDHVDAEDKTLIQRGQIATLEMMEVPDSQNGNMVRKIDHID